MVYQGRVGSVSFVDRLAVVQKRKRREKMHENHAREKRRTTVYNYYY